MGFSWALSRVMFLILMLARRAVKLFSLTSIRCPRRRMRWVGVRESKNYLGSATNAASPLPIGLLGQTRSQNPLPEGPPGTQTTVQGEIAGLPSPPKEGLGFKAAAQRQGSKSPTSRRSPWQRIPFCQLRTFRSATSFPRGGRRSPVSSPRGRWRRLPTASPAASPARRFRSNQSNCRAPFTSLGAARASEPGALGPR